MKTIMLFLSITMLMAGCASKPSYRPATNGSVGHSEQKISNDRYRVQFKIYSISVAEATDFALLRSAQLTQQAGFDWFIVTTKETFVESRKMEPALSIGSSQSSQTARQCDLLTCNTYKRPINTMDTSIELGTLNNRKEVHTVLDIRMGKGMKPNDNSYGAQDVINNLEYKAQ
jgi:hypothetical protein